MVLYFANPTANPEAHEAMRSGDLGFIDTPGQGFRHVRVPGVKWCADNGCFNDKKFKEQRWWNFLVDNAHAAGDCVFATAPDVMGDAEATILRSSPWLPQIRQLGYPVAFVLQDGSSDFPPPWDDFDVLFIGGTTEFKLGAVARQFAYEAKKRGMWVHMGRVNSNRRYRYAESIGCDSCDGTYLTFGPDVNLPRLMRWIKGLDESPALFTMED